MKRLSLFFTLSIFICANIFALEVDKSELQNANDTVIEFINYNGPHKVIDSIAAIKGIGSNLGTVISKDPEGSASTGNLNKYYVVHAVDPDETGKLDADILFIGADATVDHITNLRRIISAYLTSAYGYSDADADTLSVFITVYNAVYRGKLETFQNKYKTVVVKNLSAANCGLSVNYKDWPGKSEIVIPLYDVKNGGLSTVDTSVISDSKVVSSMKEDDDMNVESRKEMVDIKEREADEASEKAKEAQKTAVEEQKKAKEEKQKTEEVKKEAEAAQKNAEEKQKAAEEKQKIADENPDDKEAQKEAEEAVEEAETAKAEAEEKQEELNQQEAKQEEQEQKIRQLWELNRNQQEVPEKDYVNYLCDRFLPFTEPAQDGAAYETYLSGIVALPGYTHPDEEQLKKTRELQQKARTAQVNALLGVGLSDENRLWKQFPESANTPGFFAPQDELLLPYVELNTEYYDLGLLNRNDTDDRVTQEAAEAVKRLGVAVKCATITPNKERMKEYPQLKQMWKSPNATIRSALDGTVFRTPIIIDAIKLNLPDLT